MNILGKILFFNDKVSIRIYSTRNRPYILMKHFTLFSKNMSSKQNDDDEADSNDRKYFILYLSFLNVSNTETAKECILVF